MIPVCIYNEPQKPVRQAPGRKSAVEPVDDFPLLPLHFRHFPLVFLHGAWYNKVVIPQIRHQQHRERDEIMSNTKARRNIVFAVVEPNEEP